MVAIKEVDSGYFGRDFGGQKFPLSSDASGKRSQRWVLHVRNISLPIVLMYRCLKHCHCQCQDPLAQYHIYSMFKKCACGIYWQKDQKRQGKKERERESKDSKTRSVFNIHLKYSDSQRFTQQRSGKKLCNQSPVCIFTVSLAVWAAALCLQGQIVQQKE